MIHVPESVVEACQLRNRKHVEPMIDFLCCLGSQLGSRTPILLDMREIPVNEHATVLKGLWRCVAEPIHQPPETISVLAPKYLLGDIGAGASDLLIETLSLYVSHTLGVRFSPKPYMRWRTGVRDVSSRKREGRDLCQAHRLGMAPCLAGENVGPTRRGEGRAELAKTYEGAVPQEPYEVCGMVDGCLSGIFENGGNCTRGVLR